MIRDSQLFQPFNDEPYTLVTESGEWVGTFDLDLDADTLLRMYRDLVVGRLMDERLGRLQRQGKISFVAPTAGHEGAHIAVAHALESGRDWLFPYYRDIGLLLAFGLPPAEMFAQAMATRMDPNRGRQMPSHNGSKALNIFTIASPIASHIAPAVGAAISMKVRGSGQVVVTSFGEGATSEGDFHAALNFAGAQGAPVVFVCENNRYAISVEYNKQTGAESIAAKAHAYGMPGYTVDGMDPLAGYYVMREAVDRARSGLGPALVEMLVYRYGAHSSADDDSRYRPREELEAWKRRDPLQRFRRLLEKRDLWDDGAESALRAELGETFAAAAREAEEAGPVPLEWMFDDVFAERPAHLEEQWRELQD
ncbi:MAG TPA: thiamine pyrophosphate-dependent dehydrogenase E1 component subunit alpha [Trueperaceae bacterium]|nr:thiamine pyrophosphate-dependent dehydrogenase E1 component subunit alpha [Trueperaceae bacterium]